MKTTAILNLLRLEIWREKSNKIISKNGAKIISIGAVLLKVSKNGQMLSMQTNADLLTARISECVADAVCGVLNEL